MKNLQRYLSEKVNNNPSLLKNIRGLKVYFDIAFQLRNIRKSKGYTQSELAKKLSTTQPNIARWETPGYTRYSISRLIAIAEALDSTLQIRFVSTKQQVVDTTWEGITPIKLIRQFSAAAGSARMGNSLTTGDIYRGKLVTDFEVKNYGDA